MQYLRECDINKILPTSFRRHYTSHLSPNSTATCECHGGACVLPHVFCAAHAWNSDTVSSTWLIFRRSPLHSSSARTGVCTSFLDCICTLLNFSLNDFVFDHRTVNLAAFCTQEMRADAYSIDFAHKLCTNVSMRVII